MNITETHFCPKCGNQYPVTDEYFYRLGKNKDGWNLRTCKSCQSKYYKKWNAQRMADKIELARPKEDFDDFCKEAMNDGTKRATEPIISIYQEI